MRILFVIDPLDDLYITYDSTLFLVKECYRRDHENWFCDSRDIFSDQGIIKAQARKIQPVGYSKKDDPFVKTKVYDLSAPAIKPAGYFDLILIRKEPPFNMGYVYMTYLLEQVPAHVSVSNSPRGIRDTNEKMGCLHFARWMPKTEVSCRVDHLMRFYQSLDCDMVIKPLDNRSGKGVLRIRKSDRKARDILMKVTCHNRKFIMAQEFIQRDKTPRDKRITLLNGKPWWWFEKRATGKEFRTNISLEGVTCPTSITPGEAKLIKEMKPYILSHGLHLVGLDLLDEKLIDFNVTCPGGFWDAKKITPQLNLMEPWADFLEQLVAENRNRRPGL